MIATRNSAVRQLLPALLALVGTAATFAVTATPARAADGRPAELVYAERVEAWVVRLIPATPPLLRLAARCQHLERWSVPRASFPEGKVAYLNWRKSLYAKQAARAKELLLAAGVSAA